MLSYCFRRPFGLLNQAPCGVLSAFGSKTRPANLPTAAVAAIRLCFSARNLLIKLAVRSSCPPHQTS